MLKVPPRDRQTLLHSKTAMSSPGDGSGRNNATVKGVSPSNPKARPLFSNPPRPSPSLPTNQTLLNVPIPVRANPNPNPSPNPNHSSSPSSNSTNNPHPVPNSRGPGVLYPSARGGFIPNPKSMEMMEQHQPHHSFPMNMNMHMMQMSMNLHHHNMIRPPPPSASTAATIRHLSTHPRFPLTPSSPSLSVPDSNGNANENANSYKNRERDRDRDDALGVCVDVVRDRRVRFPDGASLYALCRSWLKNGFPEPDQPPYADTIKSLPRPLPVHVVDAPELKEKEAEAEVDDVEDEKNVSDLSSQELLKRHIRRAKRVRSRLREERLRRIARYKLRLALLLPPQTEQLRNDAAAGT